METYQYNIIFCGENITVNRPKYVMDKSIDFELDQFLKNICELCKKVTLNTIMGSKTS